MLYEVITADDENGENRPNNGAAFGDLIGQVQLMAELAKSGTPADIHRHGVALAVHVVRQLPLQTRITSYNVCYTKLLRNFCTKIP